MGEGSLLGAPEALDQMLDRIFSGSPVAVSLKTRLGLEEPENSPACLRFWAVPRLLRIVHPRVRKDFYRHPVRMEYFEQAVDTYSGPLCFNGGLVTPEDCARFASRFPQVDRVMIGQGASGGPRSGPKGQGRPRNPDGRPCGPFTMSSTTPIWRSSPASATLCFT